MHSINTNLSKEEKRKMYSKLTNEELIDMLIESNNQLERITIIKPMLKYDEPEYIPYHTLCGCSVCGCVMSNNMVRNPKYSK